MSLRAKRSNLPPICARRRGIASSLRSSQRQIPSCASCLRGEGSWPPAAAFISLPHRLIVNSCGRAVVHPVLEGYAAQFGGALAHRAEALGDADRSLVFGADEAGGAGERHMREQPVARRARRVGRKTL